MPWTQMSKFIVLVNDRVYVNIWGYCFIISVFPYC